MKTVTPMSLVIIGAAAGVIVVLSVLFFDRIRIDDPVGAKGGYIYYALDGVDDTQEIFLPLGLDTFLSPSLTVYKDIDNAPSWYFFLGISHAFEITEKVSLELSGSISFLLSDDNFIYGGVIVSMAF
ncbi:MAG: hypothetical protein B6I30_08870 [Desulfobacteraceae bacterium 4572_187]|nr:MAG: hypothetical protein B6I30_08870 [Desulfobacteraceae bacterium 4572_187]